MIKLGDIVYFKKVTREPTRRAQEIGFKGGTGFGVMLGIVKPLHPPPKPEHLMALMGQSGFLAFDDVKEFLGEENLKICMAKFENKYYPKPAPPPLVAANGQTLTTTTPAPQETIPPENTP